MSDGTPLGSLLIEEGLLTEAQLDAAVAEQTRTGKPLGRLLIEQGTISEAELVRTLARQVGLEFVDLGDRAIDGSVAALVSESLARRYGICSRWYTRRPGRWPRNMCGCTVGCGWKVRCYRTCCFH